MSQTCSSLTAVAVLDGGTSATVFSDATFQIIAAMKFDIFHIKVGQKHSVDMME